MSSTSKMQKNIQGVEKELAASRAKMEELAREMAILMLEIENENLNEEELEAEYAKATLAKSREEKNKRLEEECHICTEVMNKKKPEELFICGVCKNMVHSDCGEQWFKENKSCPFCRAAC